MSNFKTNMETCMRNLWPAATGTNRRSTEPMDLSHIWGAQRL